MNCEQCLFWKRVTAASLDKDFGTCHRHAPRSSQHFDPLGFYYECLREIATALQVHMPQDDRASLAFEPHLGGSSRYWPETYKLDFCGEFKPAQEESA